MTRRTEIQRLAALYTERLRRAERATERQVAVCRAASETLEAARGALDDHDAMASEREERFLRALLGRAVVGAVFERRRTRLADADHRRSALTDRCRAAAAELAREKARLQPLRAAEALCRRDDEKLRELLRGLSVASERRREAILEDLDDEIVSARHAETSPCF